MKRTHSSNTRDDGDAATATIYNNKRHKKTKEETPDILQRLSNASIEGPRAFPSLAEFLMNQCVIHVIDSEHSVSHLIRITELEFYLQDLPNNSTNTSTNTSVSGSQEEREYDHMDPFPHCMPIQLQPGQWYFHMMSANRPHSFKGGSYKGTDLTFGNSKSYAGILFRAAMMVDDSGCKVKSIEGPSLLTDWILARTRSNSVLMLVQTKLEGDLLALAPTNGAELPNRPVHLLIRTRSEVEKLDDAELTKQLQMLFESDGSGVVGNDKVYACPRVGMSLKKYTDNLRLKLRYIMKEYRFCIRPREMKKGRHNLLVSLYGQLRRQGVNSTEDIIRCMDQVVPFLKGARAKNFLEAAARGEKKRHEIMAIEGAEFPMGTKSLAYLKRFFVGSFSLATFAELYAYLEDLSQQDCGSDHGESSAEEDATPT